MTAAHVGKKVCHPVVIIKVNGVKCRALLDTRATGSYISAFLVYLLKVKPSRTLTGGIKTIMGLVIKRVETYDVKIGDTLEKCVLPVCVTKIEQHELLTLENPNYPEMLGRYPHLKGVRMEETDTKELLPIHVILEANEYTKIKMAGHQRPGAVGEPIAEQTRFGWTIMSSGAEVDSQNMFLTQTSLGDYEELCRMDILGLQDTPIGDQDVVHQEFLEQLKCSPEGWYEIALPWKGGHPPLPNNNTGSLKRLASLVQRLKRNGKLEDYDAIIQQQLEEGVAEEAEEPAQAKEFYIPHKAVIRDSSETTKMRIVYDASARAYDAAPFVNECLESGPPLQNQLWKVLVRGRFNAVAIVEDIQKAFLQVRIRAEDRDSLRFHWITREYPEQVRMGPSPFILGGVIQHHLNIGRPDLPDAVPEIERGLYVDNLLMGDQTVEKAWKIKATSTEIFGKASFKQCCLHWIRGASENKQFVGNRVRKIKEKESVIWRHVPTQENPTDLGSRGGPVNKENMLWWVRPNWLKDPASWPLDIVTTATPESEAEAKATKQVFALAVNGTELDVFDEMLSKGSLWHCLRVGAWVQRFINNTRNSEHKRKTGALTTEEINYQKLLWEKKTQKKCAGLEQFEDDKLKLNLHMNHDGALEYHGRIQGDYPVYLPDSEMFTEKLVQHAHQATLHGGVSLTMAKVRETHWVPGLS